MNYSIESEVDLDHGWVIRMHINDVAPFGDCLLKIEWKYGSLDCVILNSKEVVPTFDPTLKPDGFHSVVDGVEYCYNIRGEAYIVGLDETDTVLFSKEVVIDEVPHRVDKFYSLVTGSLTVVIPEGLSVPDFYNCEIKSLTFVCDGHDDLTEGSVSGIIGLENFGVIDYDSWFRERPPTEEDVPDSSGGFDDSSIGDRFLGCIVYIEGSQGMNSEFEIDGSAPQWAHHITEDDGTWYY